MNPRDERFIVHGHKYQCFAPVAYTLGVIFIIGAAYLIVFQNQVMSHVDHVLMSGAMEKLLRQANQSKSLTVLEAKQAAMLRTVVRDLAPDLFAALGAAWFCFGSFLIIYFMSQARWLKIIKEK